MVVPRPIDSNCLGMKKLLQFLEEENMRVFTHAGVK